MMEQKIMIKEVGRVQDFNILCAHCDYDVELKQGKYIVNAKSIMGIFSLNMDEPAILILNTEDAGEMDKFKEYILD